MLASTMGCTTSQSEDLPRLSLLKADEFFQSLNEPPQYFSTSVQSSADFVETETTKDPEMSYTGPPSHLEGSLDMHPFWAFHGLDFYNRYTDKTVSDDTPPSLLPSTSTAQELRQIEINEAITDLRQQVIGVIAEKKSVRKKGKKKKPKEEDSSMDHLTPDEKLTIEFLESVIRDVDGDSDDLDRISIQSSVASDSNWILGASKSSQASSRTDADVSDRSLASEQYDNPVPGIMQDVVTDCELARPDTSIDREDSFLHKKVYLPDNDVLIVDADCEIGANSKTPYQVDLMYFRKNSMSSLSSRSSRSSVLTNQLSFEKTSPQKEPITMPVSHVTVETESTLPNSDMVAMETKSELPNYNITMETELDLPRKEDSETKNQNDKTASTSEMQNSVPSTSSKFAALQIPGVISETDLRRDIVENDQGSDSNDEITNIDDLVTKTDDIQLKASNVTTNNDDDVFCDEEHSIDKAREASEAILRRGKVRAMANVYDRKVRESFGEADRPSRKPVVKKTGNEENLQDIAYLLMNSSNGKTQFRELYSNDIHYSTSQQPDHQKPSTSDDTVSEDSVIIDSRSSDSYEPILGQIKADLEMLQLREDDDYGMQESIDSGFVN
ncbi:uncharacterized protein LOC144433603 [Glandiceps talaboti]